MCTIPNRRLELVRRRVNRKIAWLQRHFPQAKKDYEMLKTELLGLGVTPETTYLYIQGHTLFDNRDFSLVGSCLYFAA